MTDALVKEGLYDNFLPVAMDLASVNGRVQVPITNMVWPWSFTERTSLKTST